MAIESHPEERLQRLLLLQWTEAARDTFLKLLLLLGWGVSVADDVDDDDDDDAEDDDGMLPMQRGTERPPTVVPGWRGLVLSGVLYNGMGSK